jgi:hypothetical protein
MGAAASSTARGTLIPKSKTLTLTQEVQEVSLDEPSGNRDLICREKRPTVCQKRPTLYLYIHTGGARGVVRRALRLADGATRAQGSITV